MVEICEAALSLRLCHWFCSARIACSRRSASSASRASACASARTCAASRRWPSMSLRTAPSLVSVSRLGGNSSSAAVAFSCAPCASARSAARRLCASVSADLRAAWRLISRSVAACRSRAASASRWAARQASRAADSDAGRGFQFGLGRLQRLALGGGLAARLLEFAFDIDQPRPLGETPRRAGRRMSRGDKAVPAPDIAFQRHQPLPGLQLRHQLGAALLGDDADLRQTARKLRKAPRHARRGIRRRRAGRDRPR